MRDPRLMVPSFSGLGVGLERETESSINLDTSPQSLSTVPWTDWNENGVQKE